MTIRYIYELYMAGGYVWTFSAEHGSNGFVMLDHNGIDFNDCVISDDKIGVMEVCFSGIRSLNRIQVSERMVFELSWIYS